MEPVATQNLDTTANYFSTCEPENRKRVKETGRVGRKASDCQVSFFWHLSRLLVDSEQSEGPRGAGTGREAGGCDAQVVVHASPHPTAHEEKYTTMDLKENL